MPDGVNIPGGPSFIGNPQPPDVPCDPTGDGWRGPQGPQGLPGQSTAFYGASPPGDVLAPLWWDTVSGQLYIQYNDGSSTQWVSTSSIPTTQFPLAGGTLTGPLLWTATGSTTSRSAQDRSDDSVNALDYGLLLDGTTDNTSVLKAARVATQRNGSVFLPSGRIHGPIDTTAGPTTAVLWKLDGTTFSDGTTPITQIGAPGDTLESYYNGYKFFAKRANPVGAAAPVVRMDLLQNLTGTFSGGGIAMTLNVNATQNLGDTSLVYPIAVTCTSHADNTSGGMAGIQSTVEKTAGGQCWAIQAVAKDTTGLPSLNNGRGLLGIELGVRASNVDNAVNGNAWGNMGTRIGFHLSMTRNVGDADIESEFSYAFWVSGDPDGTQGYINSVYGVDNKVHTYQVFDARAATAPFNYGTNPVAALRMAANQVVDFNGGPALNSAAGAYLQYRTATGRLYYVVAGVDQWSIDASGNVRARGTVTGSTTP